MTLNKIQSRDIKVVYADLTHSYGFYRIRPGSEPFICLSNGLLDGIEPIHLNVYVMLLDYHKSIEEESVYRLFPLRRYFEELMEGHERVSPVEPEIVILGAAARSFRIGSGARMRVIGRVAG